MPGTSEYNAFEYFADLMVLCLVLLPAFYLLPWAAARRVLLTVTGLYLLFLIAPRLALYYVVFWVAVAAVQRVVAWAGERRWGSAVLVAGICVTLTPMVVWKLAPEHFDVWFNVFLANRLFQISPLVGAIDANRAFFVIVGLSFATFRAIDLLVQSYIGTIGPQRPGDVLFFGFFPPVQVIGPVMEYSEIFERSRTVYRFQLADYRAAFIQVLVGAVKIFLLAVPLASSGDLFSVYKYNRPWTLWFELILYAWFFYLNFSGYSDIAIGIARLFGYRLKPNFSRPYTRTNPQEFWNNWHMSLTRFARRNVFVPLGGMRQQSQYFAIFMTMMVIALWHDISLPLIIFGVYHACGLIGARLANQRRPAAINPSWGLVTGKAVLLFLFVVVSFPLLVMNMSELLHFYPALLGVQT